MKLTKFLFENDELEDAGSKIVTVREAAKHDKEFWKKFTLEIECSIGYEEILEAASEDSENAADDHRDGSNTVMLSNETRDRVKEVLKSTLNDKCMITKDYIVCIDISNKNFNFFFKNDDYVKQLYQSSINDNLSEENIASMNNWFKESWHSDEVTVEKLKDYLGHL